MLRDIELDQVRSGATTALKNTWGNRYHPVIPTVKHNGGSITYSTSLVSVDITPFDEITLYVISRFLFAPVWLVKRWYEPVGMVGNEGYVDDMIRSWVRLGLVWMEQEVTGSYLRPTHALFQMFQQPPYHYCNIPFNMLTHTIAEEEIMHAVMSGRHPILDREPTMPRMSHLGFEGEMSGTNVLAENDFRNPTLLKDPQAIDDAEVAIQNGILAGQRITKELQDFSWFVISKRVDRTGVVKRDFKFHIPDLVIPVPRDSQGHPRSVAIEVELTNKRAVNYEETMQRYANNNRFGSVYWLCRDDNIASALREAHAKVGGTGTCRTYLMEVEVPYPDF